MTLSWIASIAAAYLVGSIPFGLIVARCKGIDIRHHGSRNIGATNVARVLGGRLGLLTFALDMVKGAAPVIVTGRIFDLLGRRPTSISPDVLTIGHAEIWLWLTVAVAAVAGHVFPIYLRLRGGKGVATGFGSLVAMWNVMTLPALVAIVVWYFTLRLSKYVSLASMIAALSLPVCYTLSLVPNDALEHSPSHTLHQIAAGSPPLIVTLLLAGMVIFLHRGNISRLRRGEEPKVGHEARRGAVLEENESDA